MLERIATPVAEPLPLATVVITASESNNDYVVIIARDEVAALKPGTYAEFVYVPGEIEIFSVTGEQGYTVEYAP